MPKLEPRTELRFILNGEDVSVSDVAPDATLLDWLRLSRALKGTKEGCAEGDCGACTVLVGKLAADGLVYESVNACIRFMGSLDRCHVVTVEHLAGEGGTLHPVQQAMVDFHGSQCGFCTPGFVMSLYGLWMRRPNPSNEAIEKALQGNLCRCTGYEAIMRAASAISSYGKAESDPLRLEREAITARLKALDTGARVEVGSGRKRLVVPADVDDFAAVLEAEPTATVVAGSTDVGTVSWVVPTVQCRTACYAVGTPGHSWQLVAQGLAPAAHKGLALAAKAMAGVAVDVLNDPTLLAAAQAEFVAFRAGNPFANPITDDVEPPLDMAAH